jgi:hypothetical protein
MQLPRSIVAVLLVGVVAAACGSSTPTQAPGSTQGPGGGGATIDPGGGGPTTDPGGGGPTTDPGGGGPILPGNGSGKVRYEITGSLEKNGELPFFGIGSRFGGEAGKYYAFTDASDNTQIVTVYEAQGTWLVGYVSEAGSVSATACEMSNVNTSDTRASGTFDCPNAIIVKADGSFANDGRIKGSFEANK